MYIFPVQFPPFSNREDFLATVSLFDDDTGDPVRLDGTTTVGGMPYTGAVWNVTDGNILTQSNNLITIPTYPIGAQVSQLSLTVGMGFEFQPGDPVVIADPTGQNTLTGYVISYVGVTGLLTVQIGCLFDFEIRRHGPRYDGSGYIPWYDFGVPDEYGPLLRATLGNGITFIDVGVIQIMIPAAFFQKLHAGTYTAAMTVTDSVNTRQMFIGNLPVAWGGVLKLPLQNQPPGSGGAFSSGFSSGFLTT